MIVSKAKKGISLVELITATVITAIILVAMVALIQLIMRNYQKLQGTLSLNQQMIIANEHLNKHIKDSAYVEVTDLVEETDYGTGLNLYDAGGVLLGNYNLSGTTLTFNDALAGGTSELSTDIDLTFTEVSGAQGKSPEVRIDFTEPFDNTRYVACRLTFPGHSDTWAIRFDTGINEKAYSIQNTSDGGYIIAGSIAPNGSVDAFESVAYLIKIDDRGNRQWSKTFSNVTVPDSPDIARAVQQTTDGGYVVAGVTQLFARDVFGRMEAYLLKVDNNGNHEWSKSFAGDPSDPAGDDFISSVQQTTDGGYIMAGRVYKDIYLIKTDSDGVVGWLKQLGGNVASHIAFSIQQTTDGGYIMAGATNFFDAVSKYDAYLLKVDNNGDYEWSKTFGGSDDDYAYSGQQTTDGGYIIVGMTRSFDAEIIDVFLLKVDNNGDHEWSKTFGGYRQDIAYSVQQTTDGGYVIAGYTGSFDTSGDVFYLIKTASNGDHEWSKTFFGSGGYWAYSVQQATDGGYVAAGGGIFGTNVDVIKTDSTGNCPQAENPTVIFDTPDEYVDSPVHDTTIPTKFVLPDPDIISVVPVHDPAVPD